MADEENPTPEKGAETTSDMMADSPVTFPEEGPIPAKFPPDRPGAKEDVEEDYFLFATPERSLEQIAAIREEMPGGSFAPPKS